MNTVACGGMATVSHRWRIAEIGAQICGKRQPDWSLMVVVMSDALSSSCRSVFEVRLDMARVVEGCQ